MPRLRTRAAAAAALSTAATPASGTSNHHHCTLPSAASSTSLAQRTANTGAATAHSSNLAHLSQSSSTTPATGTQRFGTIVTSPMHSYQNFNNNSSQYTSRHLPPPANFGTKAAAAAAAAQSNAFPPPDTPGHSLRKRKDNTTSDLHQQTSAAAAAAALVGGITTGDKRAKRQFQQHLSATNTTTNDSGFVAFTDESHDAVHGAASSTTFTNKRAANDSASTSAESTSSAGNRGSLAHATPAPPPAPSNRSSKYVGAHISGQGGLPRIAQIADDIGAKCLCVHVRNVRRWKQPVLSSDAVRKFTDRIARSKTLCAGPRLLAKASSLFNLGSPVEDAWRKTREGLQDELQRCKQLGVAYYVVTPGTTQGKCEVPECLERIAATVTEALKAVPPGAHLGDEDDDDEHEEDEDEEDEEREDRRTGSGREEGVQILLMNMCLQGYTVGGKLQELKSIIDQVEVRERSRVGFCMDVLAAYAAGYNIATNDGLSKFLDDVDATIGLSRLRAVRLMDSELPVGSHLHRPTSIGHGWIGLDGFRVIMNESRLNHLPMFIDTSDSSYQRDIETLYSLCKD